MILSILPFAEALAEEAGTSLSETNVTALNAGHDSVVGLIFHASPVVQIAFLILLVFSIVSWAIIFAKWRQFRDVGRSGKAFWNDFRNAKSLEEIFSRHKPMDGPLFRLFYTGFSSLVGPGKGRSAPREYDRVIRDIDRVRQEEMDRLESYLSFLAMTASTAPFIGLFGTVIGILVAIWRIGSMGSTSLAVVAPAIAEALIATAAGLGAAIPAYVFYTYFVRKSQKASQDMDFFAEDLNYRLKREYGTQAPSA